MFSKRASGKDGSHSLKQMIESKNKIPPMICRSTKTMNENNRKPFSLYHIMYFVTPPCPKIISLRLEWQSLHPYPQRKEDKKKKKKTLYLSKHSWMVKK
jgi:hypothetical protein